MGTKRLRTAISHVYYYHGTFCSSHPYAMICFTICIAAICSYPMLNLPLPGYAPLEFSTPVKEHSLPLRIGRSKPTQSTLDLVDTHTPKWFDGPPLAFIQQFIVKAVVSPWQSNLIPPDAFRAPLSKVFKLVDEINSYQYNESLTVRSFCYYVVEPLPHYQSSYVLPKHGCLMISPSLIWEKGVTQFLNDKALIESIYKFQGKTIETSPNLKDLLFGIPWKFSGISRFYMRNRQRVISYAVTLVLQSYNSSFIDGLKSHINTKYPGSVHNNSDEEQITHVFFQNEAGFVELTPLCIMYAILFMYIYFSVRKIEMVKSKWGLAFSAVAMVIASLTMSIGICSFCGLTPTLNGGEIFPYLVVIIGLENILVLTKSVVSTAVHLDVKIRVAQGLSREGWFITKNLVTELAIICLGYFTFVPAIQEFCLFAVVGLMTDFFLQMMFFVTVLSIDIRRMELSDLQKQGVQREIIAQEVQAAEDAEEEKTPQPTQYTSRLTKSKSAPRSLSSMSVTTPPSSPTLSLVHPPTTPLSTSPLLRVPKRIKLMKFWARTRMVQRLIMAGTVLWFILTSFVVYKSGIVHQLTEPKSDDPASLPIPSTLSQLSKSLEQQFGNSFVRKMSHMDVPSPTSGIDTLHDMEHQQEQQFNKKQSRRYTQSDKTISSSAWLGSTVEWWRRLSYRHWPALFGHYNISLSNRYISMLPPLQFSFIIDPQEAIGMRHQVEIKQASKMLAIGSLPLNDEADTRMDILPEGPDDDNDEEEMEDEFKNVDMLYAPIHKATDWDYYLTILLAVASGTFFIILLSFVYRCVSTRNHGKWGYVKHMQSRAARYVRQITETVPIMLQGHIQEVECMSSDGVLIVSSCLGGQIRVWDPSNGECVTAIRRASASTRLKRLYYDVNEKLATSREDLTRSASTSSNSSGIHDMKPRSLSDPSSFAAINQKLFEDQPCLRGAIDTNFYSTACNRQNKKIEPEQSGYDFDCKYSGYYKEHEETMLAAKRNRLHSKSVDSYFALEMQGKRRSDSGTVSPNGTSYHSIEHTGSSDSLNLEEVSPGIEFINPNMREPQDVFGCYGDVSPPPIWCLCCYDNLIVTGCGNGRVEVWDALTGLLLSLYHEDNKSGVTALSVSAHRIVAARLNGYLDFLELNGSGMYSPTSPHGSFQYHKAFTRHVSSSDASQFSGTLQCYLLRYMKAHQQPINELKSAGGRIVTASQDHTLKVFRLEDALCLYTLHGHVSNVTALYLDQHMPLAAVSGGRNGTIRLWDLLTGACVHHLRGHRGAVSSLMCTPAYVVSVGLDDRLCLWDRCRGNLLNVIYQESGFSSTVAMMSHDLLITGGQGCLIMWDAVHGVKLRVIKLGSDNQTVQHVSIIDQSTILCDFGKELRVVHLPAMLHKSD